MLSFRTNGERFDFTTGIFKKTPPPPHFPGHNIHPVVVVRGLKGQHATAPTNFVGYFLLALSYFFFFPPPVCAE